MFRDIVAGNDSDNKIRNIVIIVFSVVAFLILAFFFGLFLRKRMKHKETEDPKGKDFFYMMN